MSTIPIATVINDHEGEVIEGVKVEYEESDTWSRIKNLTIEMFGGEVTRYRKVYKVLSNEQKFIIVRRKTYILYPWHKDHDYLLDEVSDSVLKETFITTNEKVIVNMRNNSAIKV